MKDFYDAVDVVMADMNISYGSKKNTNGEIKYSKLRHFGAKTKLQRILLLVKALNDLCSNYNVYISHAVRDGSYSVTIAILDADYIKIQTEGFVKGTLFSDDEYPLMKTVDAAKLGVKKITIKKACTVCGDFRRHMNDSVFECVTCYTDKDNMLSAASIRINQNKHNQYVETSVINYYTINKPKICYGQNMK